MMILGEDGSGWELGEKTPAEVENFFYHLMLEAGNSDRDELDRMYRCLLNCHTGPQLAQMVMGMAAMAHDLWTASMTSALAEEKL